MKHNIRINGEVKEIDCDLGSGVYDKHGREIFEGDRVKDKFGYFSIINNVLHFARFYDDLEGAPFEIVDKSLEGIYD